MHCVPAHPRPCLKRGGRVSRVFSLVVGCSRMAFSLFEEVRINPPHKIYAKIPPGANYFVARRKCMPCAGCVIVFFISCYGRKGLGIPSPPSPPSPSSPARRRRLPVLAAVRQRVVAGVGSHNHGRDALARHILSAGRSRVPKVAKSRQKWRRVAITRPPSRRSRSSRESSS